MDRMPYTDYNFDKDVFDTLRWVVYTNDDFHGNMDRDISDERMQLVLTFNENIKGLGYTFDPQSIVNLARVAEQSDLSNLYDKIKNMIGSVDAKPMYPDFPKQVMEIDEAEFRFHQMIHYFSTYGIEFLYGVKVSKGWLPDVKDTKKTEDDKTLLNYKVIRLKYITNAIDSAFETILSKRERMTILESRIVAYSFYRATTDIRIDLHNHFCTGNWYDYIHITFKENMYELFKIIFESPELRENIDNYHFCQHTGDVWKCIDYILKSRENYHLRTSEKRILVKVLESYDIKDFRANLILSNNSARNIKVLLQYLDYNKYSRSIYHKNAVADLRDNKLQSWEGKAKKLLFSKDDDTIDFIGSRPGMLLRMITILLRNGFNAKDIKKELITNAGKLSTQTLVSLNTYFNKPEEYITKYNSKEQYDYTELIIMKDILKDVLKENLKYKNIPELEDKKVFLDMDNYNLKLSNIECNTKSEEGGYIRSGLAIKIPDEVERIRFFVYWNDILRVDIDLHGSLLTKNGAQSIGYDSDFRSEDAVFSGDITHSNAAEYIDINLNNPNLYACVAINIYAGPDSFGKINTCFVGAMAVKEMGEKVKLYNPKNCFFTHDLKSKARTILYGYIDSESRSIIFVGKPTTKRYGNYKDISNFNVETYLKYLADSQNITFVSDKNEADVVLTMESATEDNSISLLENNFFMDI
jgi:hypothetical protein